MEPHAASAEEPTPTLSDSSISRKTTEVKGEFDIVRLIRAAIKNKASDIHIVEGKKPNVRIHGELRNVGTKQTRELTARDTVSLMKQVVDGSHEVELATKGYVDLRMDVDGQTFRVNVAKAAKNSYAMVIRVIPSDLLPIEKLGISEHIITLLERPKGLFLVTGATGSGKSTTLASLINHIAQTMSRNIITVEQPVEFDIPHGPRSIVRQHEVPVHFHSFADSLRAMMRQDPDMIMVGEIRDRDTMETALHAAETGHVVFGTLHTSDAPGTVERIMDFFEADDANNVRSMLSRNLLAVLSQELVKTPDGKGRCLAYEALVNTSGVANYIKNGQLNQLPSAMQTGAKVGMQTLDSHISKLLKAGLIDFEHALTKVRNRPAFLEMHKKKVVDEDSKRIEG